VSRETIHASDIRKSPIGSKSVRPGTGSTGTGYRYTRFMPLSTQERREVGHRMLRDDVGRPCLILPLMASPFSEARLTIGRLSA
jgi:hypothetical protein